MKIVSEIEKKERWFVFGLSATMYSSCLAVNAFCSLNCCSGWEAALLGWLPVSGRQFTEWLANPILIAAWISCLSGYRKVTVALSASAALLAIRFFFHARAITAEDGMEHAVSQIGPGYWLWIASMVILAIGSLIWIVFRLR